MTVRDLAFCICTLLIASFAFAPGVSAEAPDDTMEFVRPGGLDAQVVEIVAKGGSPSLIVGGEIIVFRNHAYL